MGAISYERAPLSVLQVSDSTAEEVLDFLNSYGSHSYIHVADYAENSSVIYVRSSSDRSTTIGLLPDTVLIHDPERGGVDLVYSDSMFDQLGVSKRKLFRALAEAKDSRER